MSLKHSFKRYWQLAVFGAALAALALGLARATPARAMAPAPSGEHVARVDRPGAEPAGTAAIFGMDEGGVLSESQEARDLTVAAGVRWVRAEVSWRAVEPSPGTYDFSTTDTGLHNLINSGLSPIAYVSHNPDWAANTACGPVDTTDPAKVQAFADFMGALAARYPEVKIWALYNEVDNTSEGGAGCFGSLTKGGINKNGVPDYKEYAILLNAAWKAVHAALPNSDVRLAVGALASDNFNKATAPPGYPGGGLGGIFNAKFPADLFKYMAKNVPTDGSQYMDAVLFNYYDIYGRYWETIAKGHGIQAKANALRDLMKQSKIPVKDLFVSETGMDSAPNSVGRNGQASCLEIILVRGVAADLQAIVWWTFKDMPDNVPPAWKYGVVDENLQPKPAYTTLQTLTGELNGFNLERTVSGKPGFADIEAYRFSNGVTTKYVVWSSLYKSTSYKPECHWPRVKRMATFKAKNLRVVDYQGNATTIADNSTPDKDKTKGNIAIVLKGTPKIVEPLP